MSKQIGIKVGDGTLVPLPSEDLDFSIVPSMFSDYIQRMVLSGTTVKFKQEGNNLYIESDAGEERVPVQASKQQTSHIDISRMTLMRFRTQINGYEKCKVGIRKSYLLIEGHWGESVCKWKLDSISENIVKN